MTSNVGRVSSSIRSVVPGPSVRLSDFGSTTLAPTRTSQSPCSASAAALNNTQEATKAVVAPRKLDLVM